MNARAFHRLNLHKMSAAKFLTFWELPAEALPVIMRGMALQTGPAKRLKRMPAIELVRAVLMREFIEPRAFPKLVD